MPIQQLNLLYSASMDNAAPKTFIFIMSSEATASWHQVIGPLREWHRKRLIGSVAQSAEDGGFDKYLIFDALEDFQVEGIVGEMVD